MTCLATHLLVIYFWLFSRNFFGGGGGEGAKSIVMQMCFVMLIFLLFLTKFEGGKSLKGDLPQWGTPCSLWKKPAFKDMQAEGTWLAFSSSFFPGCKFNIVRQIFHEILNCHSNFISFLGKGAVLIIKNFHKNLEHFAIIDASWCYMILKHKITLLTMM